MEYDDLHDFLQQVTHQYYRLVLITGGIPVDRTNYLKSFSPLRGHYFNLNLALSTALLDVPSDKRALAILDILNRLITEQEDEILCIDYIELLYLPELKLDPLKALLNLSRNKMLVVSWPGVYRNKKLFYAVPGHPEYRLYHDLSEINKIIEI